ncbi:MAG: D-alanine--D-alanine ligase [Deltaproteobacteria bacterium]|nr:D-alanine--D-alanine ligase [Deltaproteobacteria bacterium]
MTTEKTRVLLLFGGTSAEHEVSCRSAAFLFRHIDQQRFDLRASAVTRDGRWLPLKTEELLKDPPARLSADELSPSQTETIPLSSACQSPADFIRIQAGYPAEHQGWHQNLVVFPLIHGSGGEDGSLQGFLDLAGVPYVGSGTTGSAVAMDKHMAKVLVAAEGIRVSPWICLNDADWRSSSATLTEDAVRRFGFPLFVKPACLGSSVGISKVTSPEALLRACELALTYDNKILIEKAVSEPRELECAILGHGRADCTGPAEIIPTGDFYTYEAKYVSANGAELRVEADIPPELAGELRTLALKIFRVLDLDGMARIDFLYSGKEQSCYFNEANTIPGFTEISQYPMLWKHAGLSEKELLSRLIDSALQRHKLRQRLTRNYKEGRTA